MLCKRIPMAKALFSHFNSAAHPGAFLLLPWTSVPHPFRVFLRNGWETNRITVYTIHEDALILFMNPSGFAGVPTLFHSEDIRS